MALIDVKAAITTAKKEVAQESLDKAVARLKELYRKRDMAQTALVNIDREITEEETRIGEGNHLAK